MVGGGVTLTANWIASHTQRYLAIEDRRQRNAEVRRDACSIFLAFAILFEDRGRELVDSMRLDAPDAKITSAYEAYYEAWEDVKRKRASVLISGPENVVHLADKLHDSLTDLSIICDSAYYKRSQRAGATRGYLDTLQDACDASAEFASIASKYAVVSESGLIVTRKLGLIRKARDSIHN
jgi:hypothetical protein